MQTTDKHYLNSRAQPPQLFFHWLFNILLSLTETTFIGEYVCPWHSLLPFIIHTIKSHHLILCANKFQSQLAAYIKKLKCITLWLVFEVLPVYKSCSKVLEFVCVCAYQTTLNFEPVCINHENITGIWTQLYSPYRYSGTAKKKRPGYRKCVRQSYECFNNSITLRSIAAI
jgi:hypothetical protein